MLCNIIFGQKTDSQCYHCHCEDCINSTCLKVEAIQKIPGYQCQIISYEIFEEGQWKMVVKRGVYDYINFDNCMTHFSFESTYRNVLCERCSQNLCNNQILEVRKSCYECAYEDDCLEILSGKCLFTSWMEKKNNRWTSVIRKFFLNEGDTETALNNCQEKKKDTKNFLNVSCELCEKEMCINQETSQYKCYQCNCSGCNVEDNEDCITPQEWSTKMMNIDKHEQCMLLSWDLKENETWKKIIRRFSTADESSMEDCEEKSGGKAYKNVICEVCTNNCSEISMRSCYECECEGCMEEKDEDCVVPGKSAKKTPLSADETCTVWTWERFENATWRKFIKRFVTKNTFKEFSDCEERLGSDLYKNVICEAHSKQKIVLETCYECECKGCTVEKNRDCIYPKENTKQTALSEGETCVVYSWDKYEFGKWFKYIKRTKTNNFNAIRDSCEQKRDKQIFKNIFYDICKDDCEEIPMKLCNECTCIGCNIDKDLNCIIPNENTTKVPVGEGEKCVMKSWDRFRNGEWNKFIKRFITADSDTVIWKCQQQKKRSLYKNVICQICENNCPDVPQEFCYECECEGCNRTNRNCIIPGVNETRTPLGERETCVVHSWDEFKNGSWRLYFKRFVGNQSDQSTTCDKIKGDKNYRNVICENCTKDCFKVPENTCYVCSCQSCSKNEDCVVSAEKTMLVPVGKGNKCATFSWDKLRNHTWVKLVNRTIISESDISRLLKTCEERRLKHKLFDNVICEPCKTNCTPISMEKMKPCYNCMCQNCDESLDKYCISPGNETEVIPSRKGEKCVTISWDSFKNNHWTKFIKRLSADVNKELTICNQKRNKKFFLNVICEICSDNCTSLSTDNIRSCFFCSCDVCYSNDNCVIPNRATKSIPISENQKCVTLSWEEKREGKFSKFLIRTYSGDVTWMAQHKRLKNNTRIYKNVVLDKCEKMECLEVKFQKYCYVCKNCSSLKIPIKITKMVDACYTEIVERRIETNKWIWIVTKSTGSNIFLENCWKKKQFSLYRNVFCLKCDTDRCNKERARDVQMCYVCFNCFNTSSSDRIVLTFGTCFIEIGRIKISTGWENYVVRNTTDDPVTGEKYPNVRGCEKRQKNVSQYTDVKCIQCHGDLCNGGAIGRIPGSQKIEVENKTSEKKVLANYHMARVKRTKSSCLKMLTCRIILILLVTTLNLTK